MLEWLEAEEVTIVLFGSRATGIAHRHSDIDIGYLPGQDFDRTRLVGLEEAIDDLNIPYIVELVDLSKVSDLLRTKALGEGIVWKS